MIKSESVLRAIYTVAVVCAFAGTAFADSVLNFTPKGAAGIAVTNTSPYAADVKFTLYNPDGTVASVNLTNNPSYRIAPMGQLAMMTWEIFRTTPGTSSAGWIQATSTISGLQGYYFSGDFVNTFDGAEASTPLQLQTIPYILPGNTELIVTNPGPQASEVIVSFFDEEGRLLGDPVLKTLVPQQQLPLAARGANARIEVRSGPAVIATAVAGSATHLALIHGQSMDARAGRWVVPHFKNGGGVSSALALTNPSAGPASVALTFFSSEGVPLYTTGLPRISAFGSEVVSWRAITRLLSPPDGDGWLLVESSVPLVGVTLLDDGLSASAVPLQAYASDRILLSRVATQGLTSELVLVGNDEIPAVVTVTFNRPDGSTAMQRDIAVEPHGRVSFQVTEGGARFDSGYVTLRSTAPVFAMELMRLGYGSGLAPVTPQRLSTSYAPGSVNLATAKVTLANGDLRPGARLKISAENGFLTPEATLWIGDKLLPMEAQNLVGTEFGASLPNTLEPGSVIARVRAGSVESVSDLGFYSPEFPVPPDAPELRGYALFQKVEVTDSGLDITQTSMVPVRHARVEVHDIATGLLAVVAETDESGRFRTKVPSGTLRVRVVSRSSSQDLRVLNNTAGNILYEISQTFSSTDDEIELIDNTRGAGAFNILDTIQRGNALLSSAVPTFVSPALTIYWSEKNTDAVLAKLTNGAIRSTFFSLVSNAAYILGDRSTDSDEYDDSVILHEYAHMLAAKFSRDDSNGGMHLLGDLLDPRIAWSEGWANFFSAAARGNSVYRDSKAGTNVLRFDLEENVPALDRPGYTSEASVHGLLWDLIDENADNGDAVQFSLSSIWGAFTELRLDRNVYLPYFFERFLVRYPQAADALRTMAVLRNIDFQPEVRPSVTNPFPRTIAIGESKPSNWIDSFTTKRTNLTTSSNFYSLAVPAAGRISIGLFLEGLGPANNPSANDLDLFLYDSSAKRILRQSDGGQNGQNEIITEDLTAGTYFIEVRSFYTREQTNTTVFNSGTYRLAVERR